MKGSNSGIVPQLANRRIVIDGKNWLIASRPTLAFLAILFVCLLLLMPWTPWMPARGLDPSWNSVLDYAFNSRLQFGPDVIFTYGPLGFVQLDLYSPGNYIWTLALRASILFLLAIFYFKLLRPLPLAYGVAIGIAVLTVSHFSNGTIYASVPVVEALVLSQDEVGLAESVGISLLCGTVSLIKFSYFIAIVIVYLITALYRSLRWREFPLAALLFAFALIGVYVVVGQDPSSLWEYLRGSVSIAAGYSEAMQTYGPLSEGIYFCSLAAALLLIIGVHEFQGRRVWAMFPVAALAAILFVMFKEGFVRHGDDHVRVAFAWLAVTTSLYTAGISRERIDARGAALFAIVVVSFFVQYGTLSRLPGDALNSASSLNRLRMNGLGELNAKYERALADIRRAVPLPEVKGTVDIYPFEQSTLLANEKSYHPRPVFQSYSAYTNYLTNRNVEFVKSGSSPQTIFFDVATIDGRLPSLDDGASWPDLLTRYDLADLTAGFLRLERRDHPRTLNVLPLVKTSIRFGEDLKVQNDDGSLIWAHIQLRKTLLGSLLTALIKAPIVNFEAILRDGTVRTFRIVPAEASAGFLLSPLVENGMDFMALERLELHAYNARRQVQNIRISPQPFERAAYQDEVSVTLEKLVLNGADPEAGRELASHLKQFTNLLILNSGEKVGICHMTYGYSGLQMFAHASSRITIDRPAATRLIVRFGIFDGAWKEGHTDGVEFRISALHAGQRPRLIWSRRLTPVQLEADRGPQEASVDLRLEPSERLVFETLPVPGGTTNWAWSYWGDVDFD